MGMIKLHLGDNRDLSFIASNSVDSVVTDAPYGLSAEPDMVEVLRHWLSGDDYKHTSKGFMGKTWDSFVPGPSTWKEAYRILKPGGYLLSFFGSRTYDMGTLAIRLAGFEIRDQIIWLYGSGFPKSHNLKGEFEGKGTALKPAHEPIVVARKPLIGTVLQNVATHGTGALNIDACRVPHDENLRIGAGGLWSHYRDGECSANKTYSDEGATNFALKPGPRGGDESGRWPANVIHDGSEAILEAFAEFGEKKSGKPVGVRKAKNNIYGQLGTGTAVTGYGDTGSIARFFYCAKADRQERDLGCSHLPEQIGGMVSNTSGQHITRRDEAYKPKAIKNNHPTVKPVKLMRYLCKLVTPIGGIVCDNNMGSGTTGVAAVLEGFGFIGIDNDPKSFPIAEARIKHADLNRERQLTLF